MLRKTKNTRPKIKEILDNINQLEIASRVIIKSKDFMETNNKYLNGKFNHLRPESFILYDFDLNSIREISFNSYLSICMPVSNNNIYNFEDWKNIFNKANDPLRDTFLDLDKSYSKVDINILS